METWIDSRKVVCHVVNLKKQQVSQYLIESCFWWAYLKASYMEAYSGVFGYEL